ncbi:MAG TPA: PBP1A family penicillin-binding protein [Abditibacteriaceae bacterium]
MQSAQSPRLPAQVGGGAPTKAGRYPRSFWWYLKWFVIVLQLVVFCAIVVTVTAGYGIYQQLSKIMPDVSYITSRNKGEATRIYASDGKTVLGEFKGESRKWISVDELKVTRYVGKKAYRAPGRLMDATLAIEDARFYTHPGMDPKRIAGAALANFRSGAAKSQGGSTITEQLAVNVYLTRKKDYARRLQTALLALQLERRFSKDEIMEMYLNEIYYGNRAYGCEAAAQTYFGKHAKNLSIAEAAMLAGLPQSPSRHDPFDKFKNAKTRQLIVLREMLENKKISYGQWKQARADKTLESTVARAHDRFLEERSQLQKWKAPYFVSYVKGYLQKQYGWNDEYLNKAGLKIYTTLDLKMQEVAEEVMIKRVNRYSTRRGPRLEGALVCIDPWTGHVLSMVGGRDYYDSKNNGQWNRAVQGKRQPGSTFKPYVYATALEAGYSPNSIVIDKPLKINGREIRNFPDGSGRRGHMGALTFREALAKSNNVAATRVLMRVGIENVVQKSHLLGIQSSLVPVPTLALGTSEVSLLEHVSAFGVFATGGLRAEETPVVRVNDYTGRTIVEQAMPVHGARVLSEEAAKQMWSMLRYVVTNGTGTAAQIDGVDVGGKTGTTSSNKDVWFMGASKRLVTGVWMGYDRPKELYGSAGGRWCAPAWRSFMVQALDIYGRRDRMNSMVEDERATSQRQLLAAQYKKIVKVRICNESGLLANERCPSTRIIAISAADGVPTERCSIPAHQPRSSPVRALGGGRTGSSESTLGDSAREETARSQSDGMPSDVDRSVSDSDFSGSETPRAESAPDERDAEEPREPTARDESEGDSGNDEPRILNDDPNFAPTSFGAENGEVVATVCADSGQRARARCPVTAQRFFARNATPRRACRLHRS